MKRTRETLMRVVPGFTGSISIEVTSKELKVG